MADSTSDKLALLVQAFLSLSNSINTAFNTRQAPDSAKLAGKTFQEVVDAAAAGADLTEYAKKTDDFGQYNVTFNSTTKTLATALTAISGDLATFIAAKASSAEVIAGTDDAKYVTAAGVKAGLDKAISDLVDGAPTALNTLKELADALANEQDAIAALTLSIDSKLGKTEQAADSLLFAGKTVGQVKTQLLDLSSAPYNVLLTDNLAMIAALGNGVYVGETDNGWASSPILSAPGLLTTSVYDGVIDGNATTVILRQWNNTGNPDNSDPGYTYRQASAVIHEGPSVGDHIGSWFRGVAMSDIDDLQNQIDTITDDLANKLGKTEQAADSAKLGGKTLAEVIADAVAASGGAVDLTNYLQKDETAFDSDRLGGKTLNEVVGLALPEILPASDNALDSTPTGVATAVNGKRHGMWTALVKTSGGDLNIPDFETYAPSATNGAKSLLEVFVYQTVDEVRVRRVVTLGNVTVEQDAVATDSVFGPWVYVTGTPAANALMLEGQTLEQILASIRGGSIQTIQAVQNALDAFIAQKATGAEAIDGTDNTKYITALSLKAATDKAIADLVNGAPTALDTLGELATQLANEQDAVSALTLAVDGKLGKTEQAVDSAKLGGKTQADMTADNATAIAGVDTSKFVTSAALKAALDALDAGQGLRHALDMTQGTYLSLASAPPSTFYDRGLIVGRATGAAVGLTGAIASGGRQGTLMVFGTVPSGGGASNNWFAIRREFSGLAGAKWVSWAVDANTWSTWTKMMLSTDAATTATTAVSVSASTGGTDAFVLDDPSAVYSSVKNTLTGGVSDVYASLTGLGTIGPDGSANKIAIGDLYVELGQVTLPITTRTSQASAAGIGILIEQTVTWNGRSWQRHARVTDTVWSAWVGGENLVTQSDLATAIWKMTDGMEEAVDTINGVARWNPNIHTTSLGSSPVTVGWSSADVTGSTIDDNTIITGAVATEVSWTDAHTAKVTVPAANFPNTPYSLYLRNADGSIDFRSTGVSRSGDDINFTFDSGVNLLLLQGTAVGVVMRFDGPLT